MQRAWITGLTVAGVVGTGGAAFAGMSLTHTDGGTVEAQSPAATASTALSTSTTYRLGDAGLVTLDSAGGVITVTSVVPASGWTLVASSAPGVHVEVSLTDTVQVVQMSADLVDGRIVASLNASATSTTLAPAPEPAAAPAAVQAPTPAPAPANRVVVLVPTPKATVAATTSASGSTHVSTPSGKPSGRPTSNTRHESGEREGGGDD
jgi:hypothetical protein